jgi:hypothetical protein
MHENTAHAKLMNIKTFQLNTNKHLDTVKLNRPTKLPSQCHSGIIHHTSTYFLLVKSVSSADDPPLSLRPQVHASTVISPRSSSSLDYNIPSARFPQAQVFVGILFSVALFSQAAFALASAIKAGHGIATHTALERRLLSARALCLGCADACSVVAAAASHLDNSDVEELVVVEKLNVGRQAARRR